jgi:hypothetical protein
VVTLQRVRWNIVTPTAASVDSSAHRFQKQILATLPFTNHDLPSSPTAISVPVTLYNFGKLCI